MFALFSLLQVAAIANNSDFRLGIRKNAKISGGKNSLVNIITIHCFAFRRFKFAQAILLFITDRRYRVSSNERRQVTVFQGQSRSIEKHLPLAFTIVLYEVVSKRLSLRLKLYSETIQIKTSELK